MSFGGDTRGARQDTARLLAALAGMADAVDRVALALERTQEDVAAIATILEDRLPKGN